MNKQRKQIIITAVLVLALIVVWANTIGVIKKRSKAKSKIRVVDGIANSFSLATSSIVKEKLAPQVSSSKQENELDLQWGRCPFSGKIYSQGGIVDLELSGILWQEQDPQAVINQEIVGIGDKIGSNTIIDIREDRVIINNGAEDIELKLQEE